MYWINSSTKRSFLQGTLFSFQHAHFLFPLSPYLWPSHASAYTSDMQMIYRWYHCHDHLIRRTDSLEKTLMLGKFEDRRRRCNRGWDGWMASLTRWTWVWANSGRQWRTRKTGVLQFMGSQRIRDNWATEKQHYALAVDSVNWWSFSSLPWSRALSSRTQWLLFAAGLISICKNCLWEKAFLFPHHLLQWQN